MNLNFLKKFSEKKNFDNLYLRLNPPILHPPTDPERKTSPTSKSNNKISQAVI